MSDLEEVQAIQDAGDDEGGGAPSWIVTFADMMTLLLCFFVLLLSFSSMDAEKFKAVANSLRQAFSYVQAPVPGPKSSPGSAGGKPTIMPNTPVQANYKEHLKVAKEEIDWYIANEGLSEHIQTEIVDDHLKVVNSNPLNFPAGEASLLPSSFAYLDMLLPVLQKFDFQIIIEGHTDDRPINTAEFRSNWELSAARAASFVLYLEANGVDSKRLSVHGYGPNRPIAPNDSPDNRARNRRIDILLKEPNLDTRTAALAELG